MTRRLPIARIVVGGLAQGLLMILFSYPIHAVLFGAAWEQVSITRSIDSWQVIPGMAIATTAWGVCLSFGFAVLYEAIPGSGIRKGRNYGIVLFLLFVPFIEVWNYLHLEIPFTTVIAGLLHYAITLPLGGVVMAALHARAPQDLEHAMVER